MARATLERPISAPPTEEAEYMPKNAEKMAMPKTRSSCSLDFLLPEASMRDMRMRNEPRKMSTPKSTKGETHSRNAAVQITTPSTTVWPATFLSSPCSSFVLLHLARSEKYCRLSCHFWCSSSHAPYSCGVRRDETG